MKIGKCHTDFISCKNLISFSSLSDKIFWGTKKKHQRSNESKSEFLESSRINKKHLGKPGLFSASEKLRLRPLKIHQVGQVRHRLLSSSSSVGRTTAFGVRPSIDGRRCREFEAQETAATGASRSSSSFSSRGSFQQPWPQLQDRPTDRPRVGHTSSQAVNGFMPYIGIYQVIKINAYAIEMVCYEI